MIGVALRAEWGKLRRSTVCVITTLAMVLGLVVLLGGITAGVASGDPELIAQAGPLAQRDWEGLLAGAAQIVAVGAMLGAGTMLAWSVGREFSEGTVVGLFAVPIGRGRIAAAKLLVVGAWLLAVGALMGSVVVGLGIVLGYGMPGPQELGGTLRLWALVALSGVVDAPVAWVSTVTRSLLAGIGTVIGLVVVAQIGAVAGLGGWMPIAAPTLWAMSGGDDVGLPQLALSVALGALFVGLTISAWSRLQLDR